MTGCVGRYTNSSIVWFPHDEWSYGYGSNSPTSRRNDFRPGWCLPRMRRSGRERMTSSTGRMGSGVFFSFSYLPPELAFLGESIRTRKECRSALSTMEEGRKNRKDFFPGLIRTQMIWWFNYTAAVEFHDHEVYFYHYLTKYFCRNLQTY